MHTHTHSHHVRCVNMTNYSAASPISNFQSFQKSWRIFQFICEIKFDSSQISRKSNLACMIGWFVSGIHWHFIMRVPYFCFILSPFKSFNAFDFEVKQIKMVLKWIISASLLTSHYQKKKTNNHPLGIKNRLEQKRHNT